MNSLERYIDSEIEYGLRALVLLSELKDYEISFEKLLVFDYMLTNIHDFDTMMDSIHPNTPYRLAKIIVKRQAYKDGLNYCATKNLIDIDYTSNGILYSATSLTDSFLNSMETPYVKKLKVCAIRIRELFGSATMDMLQQLIDEKVREHGIEFRTIEG